MCKIKDIDIKKNWLKCLFCVSFIFTLIVPSLLSFCGKPNEAWITVAAGFLCMAFTQLDKLKEFSVLGLTAKMRTELGQATQKAYASIEAIQELAEALTGLSMESLSGIRDGEGSNLDTLLKYRNELFKILHTTLNLPKNNALNAVKSFDKKIENSLSNLIQMGIISVAEQPEQKEILKTYGIGVLAPEEISTQQYRDCVDKLSIECNHEIRARIEDLEYYRKYRYFRRPFFYSPS